MRAILPPRPPNRPQGSLDSSAAIFSSAAVALDRVPSLLVYVVSSSPEESESESSVCKCSENALVQLPKAGPRRLLQDGRVLRSLRTQQAQMQHVRLSDWSGLKV